MDWMRIRWGEKIRMRDGVLLSADIYFPEAQGKFPALVLRTPYGKSENKLVRQGKYFSEHGYVSVICDVRGRGDSDGSFVPYTAEGIDGYDVIEWVADQEWCNGAIGTWGESYVASVQWRAALEKPPHLKAMISGVVPSDPFVENPTGVREVSHLAWLFMLSGRSMQNLEPVDWDKITWHLPLIDMDYLTGRKVNGWKEAFDHTSRDDHIKGLCYQTRFDELELPVMHISGWYDEEQVGTPLNYMGMRRDSASDFSRENQKLVMGPWSHSINEMRRLGDIDFGEKAIIDLLELQKQWFDRWVKGEMNGIDDEDKVSIFVMGDNEWRSEKDWPLPDTQYTHFYIKSDGHANSRFGDGTLTPDAETREEVSDSFTYDPANPYPCVIEETVHGFGGPDNHSSIERRADVLVYTSEPMQERLEVTGPVEATLYISSDVEDTDFNVKLLDVWPNGYVQRLCDGVVRCRYRNGMESEIPMTPGEVYEVKVDMWNISQAFLPGHSIRVEISSSAFPKYPRNQNIWGPLGRSAEMRLAHQVVYHDAGRLTRVTLPVIRR